MEADIVMESVTTSHLSPVKPQRTPVTCRYPVGLCIPVDWMDCYFSDTFFGKFTTSQHKIFNEVGILLTGQMYSQHSAEDGVFNALKKIRRLVEARLSIIILVCFILNLEYIE